MESEYAVYHDALDSGKLTCETNTRLELKKVAEYNRTFNAFITLFDDEGGPALSVSRKIDRKLATRKARPSGLMGIPFAMKDNIFFAGFRTTAASYRFRDFIPNTNAEIVDMVLDLGGVPIGKTNLHEIALGGTSAASYFGPVRNPRDKSRVSGGSSGGSAVAVALAKGPMLGIGTDTGGSVRVPAALCGLVGFKPTLGVLSLEGVFPLGATLDHTGLITRTMPDLIVSFEQITGQTVEPAPRRKIRVGVPKEPFFDDAEDIVVENFWHGMDKLRADGFEVVDVPSEGSYRRFSRARGYIQLKEAAWFYEELIRSKRIRARMNPDVVTLLERGAKTGLMRYFHANLVRLESINELGGLLKGVDVIATPTVRIVSPKLEDVMGKEAGRLRQMLLQNTEVFNLSGFPALSIPSNPGSSALPTAIQLVGRLAQDGLVLRSGESALRAIAR